jgi:hypothetical protein
MVVSDRTLSAEWTRPLADGQSEPLTGALKISSDNPTHVIYLAGDFNAGEDVFAGFVTGRPELDVYPLLHGYTSEGFFTAVDCHVVRRKQNYGGGKQSETVLHPSYVLQGRVAVRENELAATHVTVRLWDQDSWAQWYNLRLKNGTAEDRTVYIEQVPPQSHIAQVNGTEVTLRDASTTAYFPINHGDISISQTSVFELTFEQEVPLSDIFTKWIAPLRYLVSSGTRRTTGIDVMSIQNRTWKLDDGSPVKSWLSVHARNPVRKFVPSDEIHYLHRLQHFDFAKQLPIVYTSYEQHNTAVRQYLDYLQNRPGTPMVRLTVLAQLVETLHRSLEPDAAPDLQVRADSLAVAAALKSDVALAKYASQARRAVMESDRPTLASRLRRLDEATEGVVSTMVGSGVDWKGAIAAIRNAIVHGLPTSQFFVLNQIPIQVAVDLLEVLFELRLLVALGFTPAEARKIVTEVDPNWGGRAYQMKHYISSFDDFMNYRPPPS